MTMTKVEINVPEEIVPYIVLEDKDAQITRNAMLVFWEGSRNAWVS